MQHFLTVTRYDEINVKGWAAHVRIAGGGRIIRTARGLEIHAANPARLAKLICWLNGG